MYFFSYFQAPATRVSRPFKTRVLGSKNQQKNRVFGFGKTQVGNTNFLAEAGVGDILWVSEYPLLHSRDLMQSSSCCSLFLEQIFRLCELECQ